MYCYTNVVASLSTLIWFVSLYKLFYPTSARFCSAVLAGVSISAEYFCVGCAFSTSIAGQCTESIFWSETPHLLVPPKMLLPLWSSKQNYPSPIELSWLSFTNHH
jgi:hypothetical protein